MIQTKTDDELNNALRTLYDQMVDVVRGSDAYNAQIQDAIKEGEQLPPEDEMDILRMAVLVHLMNICVRESYSGQKSRILQTLAVIVQEEFGRLSRHAALDMLANLFTPESGSDQPPA